MNKADTRLLTEFLDNPDRPDETLRFHELQGFLFAIASSPEMIAPSEMFADALASYAHVGRSIFEAILKQDVGERQPAVSSKIGRNEPCPCGSGKKYKKCCGAAVH